MKKNGTVIFEAFSKKHIDEEIKADFPNYEIVELVEQEIELKEGLYHNGTGSVIRFIGRKK